MGVLYKGSESVDLPTVFSINVVDRKGGGGGDGVNLGKLVNGKRFLLESCLVLDGLGVSIKGG